MPKDYASRHELWFIGDPTIHDVLPELIRLRRFRHTRRDVDDVNNQLSLELRNKTSTLYY